MLCLEAESSVVKIGLLFFISFLANACLHFGAMLLSSVLTSVVIYLLTDKCC